MIEATCPTCEGRVLLPDPPAKTPEEKRVFSFEWDERYRGSLT